jgi:hypothetical protein
VWLLVPGCSLPTGAVPPQTAITNMDTGTLDAGRHVDAWSNVDTGPQPDLGPGDDAYTPPNDAYTPPDDTYTPPNDAYVPPPDDAYVPPDTGQTCDQLYGGATNYFACTSNATTCVFVTLLQNGDSCNTICAMGTGGCTSEFHNGDTAGVCTATGTDEGCATGHNGHFRICTCAH